MKSLAEVKRSLHVGDRFWCTNRLHPNVTGWRTVHKVQSNSLLYKVDGQVGFVDWPKRGAFRIEGEALFFQCEDGSPAFTYYFGDAALELAGVKLVDVRGEDSGGAVLRGQALIDDDTWVCECGNTSSQAGFYPCDAEGRQIEGTADGPPIGGYLCDQCHGRVRGWPEPLRTQREAA